MYFTIEIDSVNKKLHEKFKALESFSWRKYKNWLRVLGKINKFTYTAIIFANLNAYVLV